MKGVFASYPLMPALTTVLFVRNEKASGLVSCIDVPCYPARRQDVIVEILDDLGKAVGRSGICPADRRISIPVGV